MVVTEPESPGNSLMQIQSSVQFIQQETIPLSCLSFSIIYILCK